MRKIGQIFRFLIPLIALAALVVFLTAAGRRERATLEKNKAMVKRQNDELWSKGNLAVADEIYRSDSVWHHMGAPDRVGPEAIKQWVTECHTAFPDINFTQVDRIAEGDKVAVRYIVTGTHQGTAWGIPPTGNKIKSTGMLFQRIVGGKIVESWGMDETALLLQMGFKLVPPGGGGGK